jgi:hypothetical protein
MDWQLLAIVLLGASLLTLVVWYVKRSYPRVRPTLKQALWEQLEGRTHREGQVLTDEEKRQFILDYINRHGFTVDKKRLEQLLNQTIDDAVESERTVIDDAGPEAVMFGSTVVMAETREEAAERQEREQRMFGTPPKKPGGDEAA